MTLTSFCIWFNSRSPFLMTSWYWAFFLSGRLVSMMSPTLSILALILPDEMNLDNSASRKEVDTPKEAAMDVNITLQYIHYIILDHRIREGRNTFCKPPGTGSMPTLCTPLPSTLRSVPAGDSPSCPGTHLLSREFIDAIMNVLLDRCY